LLVGEPPHRTAFAFALGVFLGFSPFLGFHTLLGLLVAYIFRLNRAAVLVGVYLNNPWILAPYYTFATWFGLRLTGLPSGLNLPHVGLREVLHRRFWVQLAGQYELLLPAFLGSLVLALILAVVAYPLAHRGILRFHGFRGRGPLQRGVGRT
jgi:uncharacterized protein (DUF2062 family)